MRKTGAIDYVEFPGRNLGAVKRFYREAFDWRFTDWGEGYTAFEGAGLEGGFTAELEAGMTKPLVLLFAEDLEEAERRVRAAGGHVLSKIAFPGGRRFHFRDPAGNVLGVWSDREPGDGDSA